MVSVQLKENRIQSGETGSARQNQRGRPYNLEGVRFGSLVCVAPTGERASDRSQIWLCRCDCGQEIHAAANKLKYGCYTSCGCMKAYRLHDSNGYVDNTCLKMVFSETVRPDNTSGVRGVYRKRGRWAASIQYKKRSYYLGSYINKDDAIRARHEEEARIKEDAAQLLQLL